MKFYRIEGKEVFLHNNKLYVECEPLPYEYQDAIKERVQHCSNCDKEGHTIMACPKLRSQKPHKGSGIGSQPRKCKKCGQPGHRSDTCPTSGGIPLANMTVTDLKEKIQELKAQGKTSVEIATELKCTLTLVNRYW